MNKKGFPDLYKNAVDKCKSKSKKAPDGSFHPLRMSRCIRNNFFKECKKQEGRIGECRSASKKSNKMRASRLDQVKRQRGVHVSTFLLLENTLLPCGAKDKIKGASCLPSMSGHGRLSIDDYVGGGVLKDWPLKELKVTKVKDRERCLLRMALYKDQRKEEIRMYWNRAKYYDVAKKKTMELKPEFFTMETEKWVEKYLNNKNGLGYEIYNTVESKRKEELMNPIKSRVARPTPTPAPAQKNKKGKKRRNELANSPGFVNPVNPKIFYSNTSTRRTRRKK